MKTLKTIRTSLILLIIIFLSMTNANAQKNQELNPKERHIVMIAAFTATGDLPKLKNALNAGLDAGLTINQIREELVQLYAYCGFPRSLNGINTFMAVLEDRKSKGITDTEGDAPDAVKGTNGSKYEQGRKMLETLTGKSQTGPLSGANAFAPGIDTFLKEHLFADIFGRGVLSYPERELATITVLASLPGLEAQLLAHLGMGMNVGLTESQLEQAFTVLESSISSKQANTARSVMAQLGARK